ncbi:hypothetical protein GCM10009757_43820 [Streptomyces cheonanensis]|uniref:Uncharacterized protein n=1 Tax=Streptomyces cheonanensis TaxID=312720 RepID=A0ABP5H2C6_9ACTN
MGQGGTPGRRVVVWGDGGDAFRCLEVFAPTVTHTNPALVKGLRYPAVAQSSENGADLVQRA